MIKTPFFYRGCKYTPKQGNLKQFMALIMSKLQVISGWLPVAYASQPASGRTSTRHPLQPATSNR
jgi:hypothetical protein